MEVLDIIDKNGEPTGEKVSREEAHRLGIPHRTSHVWILRKKDNGVEVLLQKRSFNKDSYPGCMDISSAGHIPAGCGYVDSAIRELKEELGINAEETELIVAGDRRIRYDEIFNGREFHDRQYSRVFVLWDRNYDFTLQDSEVADVIWMNIDECIEGVRHNTFKNCISADELLMVKKAAYK